jgi:threonine dehydrogenase-like Zn-dependent dehydrogenase
MKAKGVFYVAPEKVELREFEIGDPDLFEVQIELKATALCAWDQALYKGILPAGTTYPFLHGHEGVGIVRKVGARVSGFAPGDKVTAMGNDSALFGQFANVPAPALAKLDDAVEDYEHWIAEPVSCVLNGIEWCKLLPGDRVALVGVGFMGLLLMQALAHTLVHEVIVVDVDPRRLELARQFGADQVINSSTDEGKRAIEALKANPVDVMIEAAGAQPAFDLNYEILRQAGRLNIFSWHKGGDRRVDLGAWHMSGFQVYNASPNISSHFAQIFARTVPLMKKGVFDLKPLVTHVLPVDEAVRMFEIASHQSDGYIKGVLSW